MENLRAKTETRRCYSSFLGEVGFMSWTSKFWLTKMSIKPPTHGIHQTWGAATCRSKCPNSAYDWLGVFFPHRFFLLLGIWDTFVGGINGYPRYHWVFLAYPGIHHMLTWLTLLSGPKSGRKLDVLWLKLTNTNSKKYPHFFNSRPYLQPQESCIHFLSILPGFHGFSKQKKTAVPRIRWCNKLNRYSRRPHLEGAVSERFPPHRGFVFSRKSLESLGGPSPAH